VRAGLGTSELQTTQSPQHCDHARSPTSHHPPWLQVWKRVTLNDDGEDSRVETLTTHPTLKLAAEHITHFIEAVVVPIRDDGVRGKPVTVRSGFRVKACDPVGRIALPERSADGLSIVPKCTYHGGKEGNSLFAWYSVQVNSAWG
jgi:hypothetical protein